MKNQHIIDIYKAIYKLDGIEEPFSEFGPNHPKIGDFVSPDRYFSSDFTYKLEKTGSSNLTKDEVKSTYWTCVGIRHTEYHMYMKFRSVDRINGRRRFLTYTDPWHFTAEIVDMPEKAKLIIEYKNGKYSLVELLRIFKEKKYYTTLCFKSIFLDINGNDFLEVIDQIEKENTEIKKNKI